MRGQAWHRSEDERGFSLLELVVAMIVLAILATIAIPVFSRVRENAYHSHTFASLKNGASAAEAWAVTNLGGYDSMTFYKLVDEGYKDDDGVQLDVVNADGAGVCLVATNADLPVSNEWHVATYDSTQSEPSPADSCPVARARPLVARQSS